MTMLPFNSERRAGLECGSTGAKMVLLVHRNGAFQVEHIFLEEVLFESRIKGKARPPLDVTRQLLIHKNLSGCKTIFIANGAMESCFVILPKMGKAETDGAMLLQAKKLVSWESAKPMMAFVGSDFLRERAGYLVGLADWKAVKAWGRLIEASGGLIDDVTLAACAYQALARCQRWADEFPVFLVADLGATASCFYILDRQTVKFMRKVPVGGDAITKILTTVVSTDGGPIQLTDLEAEDVKITGYLPLAGKRGPEDGWQPARADSGRPGTTDLSRVARDASQPAPKRIEQMEVLARPVIERITSEIMRSVQFFTDNAGQKVNAVFLTGGTAELQILKKHLETSVGMPVRVIDPFAGMAFTNPGTRNYAEKHGARLAMATGLALAEQPAISLLPRHVHWVKRVATFMPKAVAALLILGFLPLLVAGIYHAVKIKLVRFDIRQYQPSLQQAVMERARLDTLQKQCQESSEYVRTLQNMVGHNLLWPGVLNALADAIPPDVVLTSCGVGVDPNHPDTILIEGKVLASAARFDDAMASLLSALGASVFFKKVNIVNAQATSAESLLGTFEIQCELVH
ncbi:MAG: pilus assembly protein PilM [Kiritimatiellae bacterium]|nr:pilus assembly protein PilM [Kiritimatiellia bacterium]